MKMLLTAGRCVLFDDVMLSIAAEWSRRILCCWLLSAHFAVGFTIHTIAILMFVLIVKSNIDATKHIYPSNHRHEDSVSHRLFFPTFPTA